MRRKYKLTKETMMVGEKTLHRIKALRSFGDVKEGDLGVSLRKKKISLMKETAGFMIMHMFMRMES